MKNSLYCLIIFIFLFNCSSKNDELLIDIKAFKNQGTKIILEKNTQDLAKEVNKINKFSNYQSFNLKNWHHVNFQSSNFIPHMKFLGSLNITDKNKFFSSVKLNTYEKNILSFNDKIYYIDDYGNIYTLDLNLRLINKFSLYKKKSFQDYWLKFSMASNGEFLFISDNLGNIYSYSPKLNKLLWTSSLGVPFISNLIFYKNNLYVVNENGKIYSFDSKTGNQNWSYESAANIIKNYSAYQVTAELDKVIFSNDLGDIYCIDLIQNKLVWSINVEVNNMVSNSNSLLQFSKILIKDDDVFFSINKKKLFNLSLVSGNIKWVKDLPGPSTITSLITPNNVINITNNGYISILDKVNGLVLYRKKLLTNFKNLYKDETKFLLKYSFISSDHLYLISEDGIFFKISTTNLKNFTYKKIIKSISSYPVVISNMLYILDGNGTIYKIK